MPEVSAAEWLSLRQRLVLRLLTERGPLRFSELLAALRETENVGANELAETLCWLGRDRRIEYGSGGKWKRRCR